VEYAGYVAYKLMSMRCQSALGGHERPESEVDDFISELQDGRRPLPDPARTGGSWVHGAAARAREE
jgi:hypothetical protein